MKKLLSLVKGKYLIMTLITPLLMIGEVIMETVIPRIMADLIDNGIGHMDIKYVIRGGFLMLLMSLISMLFGAGAAYTSSVASMGFGSEVRKKLFNKVQDFSFSNVDKFSTSSLITRLTTDITNLQNSFMTVIRMMFRSPVMMISASVMAFSLNAKLASIFLVAVPFLAIFVALIMVNAHPRFKVMLKKYDNLNSKVQENLIGIRVVKAFVRGDYEREEFDKISEDAKNAQIRAEKLVILNMPVMHLLVYICTVLILWLGGKQIVFGTMTTGHLVSFITYTTQILMSLLMVSMSLMMLVISRASVSRINEVLNEDIHIKDTGIETEIKDGSIIFENVAFSYTENLDSCALRNINFEIKSGETVGIIGGTGSSKSTLVHLIPRFYDVTDGRILVGGKDVREYTQESLRSNIAMVLQKNVLFSGSIKENLRWGDKNATDEEIIEACKDAQAHDFIMSFPNGYDTDLNQGGVNV